MSNTFVRILGQPRMLVACLVATMVFASGNTARAGDDPSLIPDHIELMQLMERFDALASQTKLVPKNPEDYYDENGNFDQTKYEHDLKHHPEKFKEVPWLWWLVQLATQGNTSGDTSSGDRTSDGDSSGADSLWNDINVAGATPIEPAFTLLPPTAHVGTDTVNPVDAVYRPDPVRFGQFGNGFVASPVRPGAVGIAGGR